ncbi:MAG: glycosyltransferase family A protein [Planctomycetota bacterium]|jgi:glycosyltransferase involved in cell wall biosynthesis
MDSTQHDNQAFTVSAVIPAYNIGKLVARAIDSVLAQTHKADEIIVVDDSSTDDTADIIKSYGSKVIYIYQENLGLAGARNTGIKAASSQWIALLDGDDEWLPDNLTLQMALLKRNPDLVWSAGNYINCLCNEDRRGPDLDPAKVRRLLGGKDYLEDYFETSPAGATGHPNTIITEDHDMWFRMAVHWPKIGYIPDPIAVYHLHRPGSLLHVLATAERQDVILDMFDRIIKMARDHNRMDKFKPCLVFCLHRSIRSILFEHEAVFLVRDILARFDQYLSAPYKMTIRLLVKFPRATAAVLHMISKIIRLLKLRRKVLRRPRK